MRPFSAFVSANLSGEVLSLIVPLIGSVLPALSNTTENLMDSDVGAIAPALANSFSSFSGDKLEDTLKKLLVKYRNVSVQLEGERDAQVLTEDLANEVFCGDAQDMFILAADVITANFSGFFKKLGDLFGGRLDALIQKVQPGLINTAN